jgi:hypothetical protein
MMAVAVAGMPSDFAVLKAKAGEVERHTDLPSRFQVATESLNLFSEVALAWDRLDEPRRDVLRHLAHSLGDRKISWFRKQRAALEAAVLVMRHGVDEVARKAHALVEARDRFCSLVMEAEERNNEALQSMLAEAITSTLTTPSTTRLTRGQVGEWIKRLPR